MNKKEKKIIISIIITIIIIIIISIFLKYISNNQHMLEENNNNNSTETTEGKLDEVNNGVIYDDGQIDRKTYFNIKSCINMYLEYINLNNGIYYGYDENGIYSLVSSKDDIGKKIYSVLSNNFILKNNITINNYEKFVKTANDATIFVPLKIKEVQSTDINSYLVYGMLENVKDNTFLNYFYVIVNMDYSNMVFSIEPLNEDYESLDKVKIDKFESTIEKSDNNIIQDVYIDSEGIAEEYLDEYKKIVLGKPEIAYKMLDMEYQITRFQSEQDFEVYVEQNREKLKKIKLDKYKVSLEDDGSTKIICIDNYGNYYIFKESKILGYSMILDTYTIDLPEFVEKYNSSKDQTKVGMNIEKIKEALNFKDYKYIYGKLNESFKNEKFQKLEDLKKFLQNNFFDNNKIEYLQFSQKSGVYIYELDVYNMDDSSKEAKHMNMIVELKDKNDFEFSFNIQ